MLKRLHVLYAPDEPPQGGVTVDPPAPASTEPPASTDPPVSTTLTEPPEPEQVPVSAVKAERARRQAAQERERAAREEAAYLRGQLEARTAPASEPATPAGPPQPPKADDYEDYDAFLQADRQHIIEMARYEAQQVVTQAHQQAVKQRTQQEVEGNWQKQRAAAVVKYPDFNEVVGNPAFTQSPTVADVIKGHEQGADVAYYLGTNLAEANRINAMSPTMAAMELGRIAATLATRPAAPAPRVVSMAPEPVSTVAPGASIGGFDPETATMAEYRAHRMAELQRR